MRRSARPFQLAAVLGPLLAAACGAAPADVPDAAIADATPADPPDAAIADVTPAVTPDVAITDTTPVVTPDVVIADATPVVTPDASPAPDAAVDAPAPDAAPDVTDVTDVADAVDPRLIGTFHLGNDDEFNLVIEPDGTFRWRRSDCARDASACGRWHREGRELVLSAPTPGAEFAWVVSSLQETVVTARVSVGSGTDEVIVRGMGGGRVPRAFEQTWSRGRVCATCTGTMMTGPATACGTPVPDDCRR